MAAKIKEGLRDITQGVVERLKGGPKYADNLLGETLADQLRKATAKDLIQPSEELNSQVVDTINQDIVNGKDSREIVVLLKKRLRTDNPHKQWLAVKLVGRVMRDCSAAIGLHQEELLQEVARTMARPARPESEAGKNTRAAAKELLRSYGRAAADAFRAVHRAGGGSNATEYAAAVRSSQASEANSVVAEVQQLIEQASANTELLSEMLLAEQQGGAAQGAGAGSEFENELTRDLVTEVRELRTLFDAYLEQLQALEGPEAEATMMRALEAVDALDGALALQKDVSTNQHELEQQFVGSGGGAAPAPAAGGGAVTRDLIDLDDFALPQPPPVLEGAAPAHPAPAAQDPSDPFAGLTLSGPPVGSPPVSHPPAPPAPLPAAAYPGMYGTAPSQPQQPYPYGQPAAAQLYAAYGAAAAAPPPPAYSYPPQQPAVPAAAPNPNNPFSNSGVPALPPYGSGAPVAAAGVASSNPFTAVAAPAGSGGGALPASTSVDSEWAMFFADRTGAAGQPAQAGAGAAH
ncbi:hypothetical protein GPECTOR_36g90 [Gonium pectorale]|uniref:VHS domain-containing protein n=1 Tax=Gonium pectorale TaxID=33097 RepID=A0A150GC17_GONPE|nr:hypothetical protein GPECTOR_36g90 [Gonium pectorale]|eukprot:KXZ47369.1 hypothetical protein GPECTOR_36g90 [Gonium pectorale]